MAKLSDQFLDATIYAQTLRRWRRAARKSAKTDLGELRQQRSRARQLKTHLDRLIHTADERLALPVIGSNSFVKPHNADWAWRPELWRGPLPTPGLSSVQNKSMLGDEVTLFHDCTFSELTLRQLRNLAEEDLAPYGLRLDVFKFHGSFLSLVVDLPAEGVTDLRRTHLLRMDVNVEMEKPLRVEFDLAYSNLNEKRVEKAWIDLIFEGPQMNQVILRDLTFSRRPRAQL